MKQFFSIGLLAMALAGTAFGQASYTNSTTFNAPPNQVPQIDTTNFVNLGPFNIVVPLGLAGFGSQFDFSDVLSFSNRSSMTCNTGFIFDDAPSGSGLRRASASFGNANQGVIAVGSATNSITLSLIFPYVGFSGSLSTFPLPELDIFATNIVNTGLLDVGVAGVINMGGNHLDLSKGSIHVEGLDEAAADNLLLGGLSNLIGTNVIIGQFSANNIGIFNVFQGIGLQTNLLSIFGNFTLPFAQSPFNNVTNVAGLPTFDIVTPPNATPYVFETQINNSNTAFQVVFINTNLPGISTDVRFEAGGGLAIPVVQWSSVVSNIFGQPVSTNFLYLSDEFGSFQTNFLVTNSFTLTGVPLLAPFNYTFNRSFLGYTNLPMANTPYDANTVFASAGNVTNAYSALEVNIQPVAFQPDPSSVIASVTNVPGRIAIKATNWLDLTRAKITGPSYMNLSATNHFVGSANASIAVPNVDIAVNSTNGLLSISNLVAPNIPRLNGLIDIYSARWTNIVETTIAGTNFFHTNTFHVLIVDSGLTPSSLPSVLNITMGSTNTVTHLPANVVISDVLNVTNKLLVRAPNLTITTNDPTSPNSTGELILFNQTLDWPSSAPILQNLTNFGVIETGVNTVFQGVRNPPYYSSSFVEPYLTFVNHGLIVTAGQTVAANYVENTSQGTGIFQFGLTFFTNSSFGALLYSTAGPLNISAGTAILTNDTIAAPDGDITLSAVNLTVINHTFTNSGSLSLSISNTLVDGGAASSNFWLSGDGINLLVKPAIGDFLGTTVDLPSPPGLEVANIWAGLDLGPNTAGFMNNAALGHLILDGGDSLSQYSFTGPDGNTNYALYVDLLDLRNGATNRLTQNGFQNFTAFDLPPNFKIYFADAVIGPFDISEKLNGANNNQLIWVPAFAGIFSGTNFVSPSGVTNFFNRPLVQSTDIDSNGNGTANAFDPNPIFTGENVNLSISVANAATNKIATVKWNGLANSTNLLYYRTNLLSTNWSLVLTTNQGPVNGPITVKRTNSPGYYKVEVIPSQP